jgi:hypothetical protein
MYGEWCNVYDVWGMIVHIQYWMYQYRAFTILEYQNRWSIHNTGSSSSLHLSNCQILEFPVLCVLQYQYYQYCWMRNTGASGIVYRSTILVFQYCKCTLLVHPVVINCILVSIISDMSVRFYWDSPRTLQTTLVYY